MKIGRFVLGCIGVGLDRSIVIEISAEKARKEPPLLIIFSDLVAPLSGARVSTVVGNEVLSYRKRITRAAQLDIEEKMHVCTVGTVENNRILIKHVYDRSVVPDYTVLYVVFGLCGGAIVAIVSIFSKILLEIR